MLLAQAAYSQVPIAPQLVESVLGSVQIVGGQAGDVGEKDAVVLLASGGARALLSSLLRSELRKVEFKIIVVAYQELQKRVVLKAYQELPLSLGQSEADDESENQLDEEEFLGLREVA